MSQFYIKRRIEKLEKTGPKLSLVDLITVDQRYIDWYIKVYGPTKLMKTILED
jgi:hypothetical protein